MSSLSTSFSSNSNTTLQRSIAAPFAVLIPPKPSAFTEYEFLTDTDEQAKASLTKLMSVKNPRHYVRQLLKGVSDPEQRAQLLFKSQIGAGEHSEFTNGIIAFTQHQIEEEKSWEALGLKKQEMWNRIRYNTIIVPAIQQYTQSDARKVRFLNTIESHWRSDWKCKLDPENSILPSYLSEHLLGSLHRLAKDSGLEPAFLGELI